MAQQLYLPLLSQSTCLYFSTCPHIKHYCSLLGPLLPAEYYIYKTEVDRHLLIVGAITSLLRVKMNPRSYSFEF